MLFNYLVAPIALAASVVCSPPGYSSPNPYNPSPNPYNGSPDYRSVDSSFKGCTQKFRQVREPIAHSCQNQAVQDVTSQLGGLYEPIHSLSVKLQASVRIDSSIAVKSTSSLVELFGGFQGIVDTLSRYPQISASSRFSIQKINSQFESILKVYASSGVSIKQVFSQQTLIKFETFSKVGFTFPGNFELYGHNN